MGLTRNEFMRLAGAAAILPTSSGWAATKAGPIRRQLDFASLQREIDDVTPQDYLSYMNGEGPAAAQPALARLDRVFDAVLSEVRETVVVERPAVWFVYNMGVVVKTPQAVFSIDLVHRHAQKIAPLLDFALITHNHRDHFTEAFYRAMDGAGKTVVSNFKDNYGAKPWNERGGYARAAKVFHLKDVEIRASLTDHNPYLVDFTTAFEIHVGRHVLYHTGDCCAVTKLNPTRRPDLWLVHPYCGLDVADGVRKFRPVQTAMLHLNEFSHPRDKWRWTYEDGLRAKRDAENAGGEAFVPVGGDRLV